MLINTLLKSRSVIYLLTALSVHITYSNSMFALDEAKTSETDAVETGSKEETSAVKHPANRLAKESTPLPLNATGLVHEAYLRLVGTSSTEQQWDGRSHFFAAAAEAMRRILVDAARRRRSQKHGGDIT